mgnify:FL=1
MWSRPSTSSQAVLNYNNIDSSEPTLLKLTGSDGHERVDAANNYWGAATTAELVAGTTNITAIHDFWDDFNLVEVDFSGFLTSPVSSAGPDW